MRSFCHYHRRHCVLEQYVRVSDLSTKLDILFYFVAIFLAEVVTVASQLFVLAAMSITTFAAPVAHAGQCDRYKEAREYETRRKRKNERDDPL